ncbi:MAG TPA: DUF4157 domain-containing protein [Phototrophicaceae bacterium]|nr:DUF4157 domain-containing protein [Phototrophicaceae bacterium]
MAEFKHVSLPAFAEHGTRTNAPATETPAPQTNEIDDLQHVIGNHAVQRLLDQSNPNPIGARIQTKMHVGAANDSYEKEADSVASAVMSMSDTQVQRSEDDIQAKRSDRIQREESPEMEDEELQAKRVESIQREESPEMEEEEIQAKRADIQREEGSEMEEEELQTKRVDMMGEFDVNSQVEKGIQQTAGSGQALPESTRSFLEPRFGHDFSSVNVHADSSSDSLNRSIQARAFTRGSDIYFANGEYQPDSSSGRELLAHELTHVIQQTGGSPKRK